MSRPTTIERLATLEVMATETQSKQVKIMNELDEVKSTLIKIHTTNTAILERLNEAVARYSELNLRLSALEAERIKQTAIVGFLAIIGAPVLTGLGWIIAKITSLHLSLPK